MAIQMFWAIMLPYILMKKPRSYLAPEYFYPLPVVEEVGECVGLCAPPEGFG